MSVVYCSVVFLYFVVVLWRCVVVVALVLVVFYLSICLATSLKTKLFSETSSVFELDNIKNAAIQRDFLSFWTWQGQNEAILRDFLNFRSWRYQKRSNSARLPSKIQSWVQSSGPRANAFCDFSFHLSAVLRLPRNSEARSHEVLHLSHKSILPKPEDLMLQNATPLRKSAPGSPDMSDSCVSSTAPATRHASLQILFKCPTPANVVETVTKPPCFARFWQGAESLTPATQNDASTSKSGANMWCLWHFDFEMCFAPQWRILLNVSTSTSALRPSVFYTAFDFQMCFAPERRAFFQHLNLQKCSNVVVFLAFWLRNLLRATTACNSSSLIWPDGSAPAALVSLRFEPPEPQNIGKTRYFGTFLPFRAPASSFFWRFLFSDLSSSLLWLFPPLLFHLSILSEVWLLNFLRLVGLRVNMFGRRISELAATGVEESSRFQLAKRLKHSCENLWNLKLAKLLLFFITFILFEVSAGSLGFCCIGFQLRW